MITRFPGLTPTRSRAVVHNALKRINESLTMAGSDKSRILSAIVYVADIKQKEEMNRAWDEWADRANPPMRACLGVDLEPPHLVEIVVTAAATKAR